MKKIKFLALLMLVGLMSVSCNDVLDDNVNPDRAHKIEAKDGLPVIIYYAQQIVYDHSEYYAYFSQMLTTGGKSSVGAYSYKCEWEMLTMNRHPMWRRHFYDIGKNTVNLVNNSKAINSPNYELIGRTIMLMSTQLTTDAFGDIPRSEAYQSIAPTYDTQASVYAWMMQECEDLIKMYEDPAIVNSPDNQPLTPKEDRVYGGDLEKWKGLVYAIKARLLLRNIPNVDRSPAMCQKIIDAADAAINQSVTHGSATSPAITGTVARVRRTPFGALPSPSSTPGSRAVTCWAAPSRASSSWWTCWVSASPTTR